MLSSLFTRFFFYFLFLSVPVLRLIFLLRKHQKAAATDQINTPLYQQYIESLCKKYFCFSKEKISKRTKRQLVLLWRLVSRFISPMSPFPSSLFSLSLQFRSRQIASSLRHVSAADASFASVITYNCLQYAVVQMDG